MGGASLFATALAACAVALVAAGPASAASIPADPAATSAAAPRTSDHVITVLTYNVRGLPWPLALDRARSLKAIGSELGRLRREGRHPTVVLIQEGFRSEIAELVKASGYPHVARGPSRHERSEAAGLGGPAYIVRGEGWGKVFGGGLLILSDLPIIDVRRIAYRGCAGWDCLANKGAMWARLRLADGPVEIDVVNTHMNAKRASGVPRDRSLKAHRLQTDQLLRFIGEHGGRRPLVVGGDFNVKDAPDRYDYRRSERPYTVVSEFCSDLSNGCEAGHAAGEPEPWLRTQDLQAFASTDAVSVRPEHAAELFGADEGREMLSDHVGYLVRYRVSWDARAVAAANRERDFAVTTVP